MQLVIAEKPSVAQEFAKALKLNTKRQDGYLESEDAMYTDFPILFSLYLFSANISQPKYYITKTKNRKGICPPYFRYLFCYNIALCS